MTRALIIPTGGARQHKILRAINRVNRLPEPRRAQAQIDLIAAVQVVLDEYERKDHEPQTAPRYLKGSV